MVRKTERSSGGHLGGGAPAPMYANPASLPDISKTRRRTRQGIFGGRIPEPHTMLSKTWRRCLEPASQPPMKTVEYVRVSTDKQADQGVSLDAQAEKIRAVAVVQGPSCWTSSSMAANLARA